MSTHAEVKVQYPLLWPAGWRRTVHADRARARFAKLSGYGDATRLSVVDALGRVQTELSRLGVDDGIVSTNVERDRYGEPRVGRPEPDDPGAALYFRLNGKDRVLACDRWDRVADNIAAIAKHIECVRGIDRYGVGTLDQAFGGYEAIAAPGANNWPTWRKVFGFSDDSTITSAAVNEAYRDLAKKFHPDQPGGSHEAMAMLNAARDAALAEILT